MIWSKGGATPLSSSGSVVSVRDQQSGIREREVNEAGEPMMDRSRDGSGKQAVESNTASTGAWWEGAVEGAMAEVAEVLAQASGSQRWSGAKESCEVDELRPSPELVSLAKVVEPPNWDLPKMETPPCAVGAVVK